MRESPFLLLGGLFCLCVVPRLAEALWQGDGALTVLLAVVVGGFIVAIAPGGAPSLSRYRAEPTSRLGPDGLQSTIAGENQ